MELRWRIGKVSTVERIFEKIATEIHRPIGIILLGVDGDLKDKTRQDIKTFLGEELDWGSTKTRLHNLLNVFCSGKIYVLVLDSKESADRSLRRSCATSMRKRGAASVVEIYAKVEKTPIFPLLTFLKRRRVNREIMAIEQSRPLDDDWGFVIEVSEKGGIRHGNS